MRKVLAMPPRKVRDAIGSGEAAALPERPQRVLCTSGGEGGAAKAQAGGVRIAVNLADVGRIVPLLRAKLFSGKLDAESGVIRTDSARPEEAAVAFSCGLVVAASVCDIIRAHDRKAGDPPTRCYVFRKVWSRVPSHVLLSVLSDGKTILNPALFAGSVEAGEAAPLDTPLIEL